MLQEERILVADRRIGMSREIYPIVAIGLGQIILIATQEQCENR
jgi:hypothetical protein